MDEYKYDMQRLADEEKRMKVALVRVGFNICIVCVVCVLCVCVCVSKVVFVCCS